MFYLGLCAAVLAGGLYLDRSSAKTAPPREISALHEDLARERASSDVLEVARWAIASHDHDGLPFLVIDKSHARLFAFDESGRLRAHGPVLLGAGFGDTPAAPATPAGRFVADTWLSGQSDAIVWVHAGVTVSLYAAPSPASPGRAQQRLASGRVEDKRISDGSLHVASDFYREHLAPLHGRASVAYVLPEARPVREVFALAGREPQLAAQSFNPIPLTRRLS
ncbi:murein L,D-transpeptidase [Ramlibacter sp. WS9]|nr:murein L,D-transpeptidase [Ramlibacter sp. WS9]